MDYSIDKIHLLEKENAELKLLLIKNQFQHVKDEKWSENITDCLPNPLFIKDENHCYVSVNRAFTELVNIKKKSCWENQIWISFLRNRQLYFLM